MEADKTRETDNIKWLGGAIIRLKRMTAVSDFSDNCTLWCKGKTRAFWLFLENRFPHCPQSRRASNEMRFCVFSKSLFEVWIGSTSVLDVCPSPSTAYRFSLQVCFWPHWRPAGVLFTLQVFCLRLSLTASLHLHFSPRLFVAYTSGLQVVLPAPWLQLGCFAASFPLQPLRTTHTSDILVF